MSTHPLTPLATDDRLLLGVARALAARFGVDPLAVRLAFVTLTVAGGWGLVLYLALYWLWLPDADEAAAAVSGQAAARQRSAVVRTLGVAVAMAGALLILRGRAPGFADGLVWPVALVSSGLMLAWHQFAPLDRPEESDGEASVVGSTLVRVGGGTVLLVAGLGFLLATNLSIDAARDGVVASAVVAAGLLLMFGPWVIRLTRTAADERSQRIRADERAEVAAHLHDSVLQTLTLMQKQASDPDTMAALARQQERELRRWLYSPRTDENGSSDGFVTRKGGGFVDELEAMSAEVEDQYRIRIEVVTVGNMQMDTPLRAIVGATRESLVNAGKFSGERQVSLYAQVTSDGVEVFVRDRGSGFDLATVPPDRRGIAESITGRMQRAGGGATIKTAPGEGTEVHIRLPRASVPKAAR